MTAPWPPIIVETVSPSKGARIETMPAAMLMPMDKSDASEALGGREIV
jgi:hypothetical protein